MLDPQYGGFGNALKFPHPSAINLLLDAYLETRRAGLLRAVTTTRERMGRGGVYDQIGGGFHRYSVDARWIVPHFEKMSYDNGRPPGLARESGSQTCVCRLADPWVAERRGRL